jgi:hypothetical protein
MSDTYLYLSNVEYDEPKYCAKREWTVDQRIAWFRRREFLRNNKDAWIPDDRPLEREYHTWWHKKGKFYSLKHYAEGAQEMH